MNPDAYVADVNHLLDTFREIILKKRPQNVLAFIQEHIAKLSRESSGLETCERITLKVPQPLLDRCLTIVVLGASGDLAKKKTFPSLFQLYCGGLLPPNVNIVGYARTKIDDVEKWKRETLAKYFGRLNEVGCHVDAFLSRISYMSGSYNRVEDFQNLNCAICRVEDSFMGTAKGGNRLYYLALPPTAFVDACTGLRSGAMPPSGDGWVRVVIEKPFGRDTESSAKLSEDLAPLFTEAQLFRIDHYLGKEMVQNIITTRFALLYVPPTVNCSPAPLYSPFRNGVAQCDCEKQIHQEIHWCDCWSCGWFHGGRRHLSFMLGERQGNGTSV